MSYSPESDPLQLSHLAEEARVIAEAAQDPGAKKTLTGIAEAYEAMLKRAERKTADK
jgi:hypothetical protein